MRRKECSVTLDFDGNYEKCKRDVNCANDHADRANHMLSCANDHARANHMLSCANDHVARANHRQSWAYAPTNRTNRPGSFKLNIYVKEGISLYADIPSTNN